MSKLIPFQFENNPVRVIADDNGEPWFNAKEICDVLGYGNHRQAVDTHVDMDDVQKLDAIDDRPAPLCLDHERAPRASLIVLGSSVTESEGGEA